MNRGCYAETGPIRLLWNKVSAGINALTFDQLLRKISLMRRGTLWRYGQAGDLPNDREQILALAQASRGRPALVYTHKRDVEVYREARDKFEFNINLSASSLEEADVLSKTGLPVVAIIPSSYQRKPTESLRDFRRRVGSRLSTPGGVRVAICPATYLDTNCSLCRVCSRPRSADTIIGFPAHGTRKGMVDRIVSVPRSTYGRPNDQSHHRPS